MLIIGVLGPENTFSDSAADFYIQKFSKKPVKKILFPSIWDIFKALKHKEIQEAIVPIENNIHGTVRETFDYLFQSNLFINLKISLPIHHVLAVKKATFRKNIKKILSHHQALSQCSHYIRKNFPNVSQIGFSSTALAIKNIRASKCGEKAVICSKSAALKNNLRILDKNIEDRKGNRTYFAVLGLKNTEIKLKKAAKLHTSIAFHFKKDSPGTLFSVFKEFNDAKVNMTRIESRPAPKKYGEYIFFLDFEGNIHDLKISKLLKRVEKKVAVLKVFGTYPVIA
jgi:prephenate dehydratase